MEGIQLPYHRNALHNSLEDQGSGVLGPGSYAGRREICQLGEILKVGSPTPVKPSLNRNNEPSYIPSSRPGLRL